MIGDGDVVLRKIVVGVNAFVPEVKIIIIMEKSSTVGAIIFFITDVMLVISVVDWMSRCGLVSVSSAPSDD
jgi:hypothetical protein